uniref:Uncharacterized protein n=1 Tax=Pararge aegeria TaxID=116150 RepID=S4P6Z8_9NEOP
MVNSVSLTDLCTRTGIFLVSYEICVLCASDRSTKTLSLLSNIAVSFSVYTLSVHISNSSELFQRDVI